MKNIALLVLILFSMLLPNISTAASDHFVEVVVSDTVVLKALHYTYEITIGQSSAFPDFSKTQIDNYGDKDSMLKTVEFELDKANFKYRMDEKNKYTKTKDQSTSISLLVDLVSKEELEKLFNLIVPMPGVYGDVISVQYESAAPYYDQMFRKLYAQARQEADLIAKTSGSNVSKVVSITEVKDQADYYGEMMKQFSKIPIFNQLFSNGNRMTSNYIRKFTFRFEIS